MLLLYLAPVAIAVSCFGLGTAANFHAYHGIDNGPARLASALTSTVVDRPARAQLRVRSEASSRSSHAYDAASQRADACGWPSFVGAGDVKAADRLTAAAREGGAKIRG